MLRRRPLQVFSQIFWIQCFVYNWPKRASSENFNVAVCVPPTRHRWPTSTWSLGGFATSASTASRKVSVCWVLILREKDKNLISVQLSCQGMRTGQIWSLSSNLHGFQKFTKPNEPRTQNKLCTFWEEMTKRCLYQCVCALLKSR